MLIADCCTTFNFLLRACYPVHYGVMFRSAVFWLMEFKHLLETFAADDVGWSHCSVHCLSPPFLGKKGPHSYSFLSQCRLQDDEAYAGIYKEKRT